ncbi:hypothetical protein [Erysipelothrix anatis]|uniref:hypothetical protein n=1 Tax=Erysipelothrix anatis TaxID=2683713 RepID=UPI00135CDAAB|nr:hypothetical protein [Erysipelothrix anatis]
MDKEKEIVIDGAIYIKKETALYERTVSKLLSEIEATNCRTSQDVLNLAQAVSIFISLTTIER